MAEHLFRLCLSFKMIITNAKAGMSNLRPLDGATVGAAVMDWRSRSRAMDLSQRETPTHQSTSTSTITTSMESLLRKARSTAATTRLKEAESRQTAVLESGLGTQTTLLFRAVTSKSSRRLNTCHTFPTHGVTAACLDTFEMVATDAGSLPMSEGCRSCCPM